MKALDKMNNVEKGKLLADLFPDEVSGILEAIEKRHYQLVENKDSYAENWDKVVTIDFWYGLAHEVFSKINRQRKELAKSRRFADQLFDGYCALFTIECIVIHVNNDRMESDFYHMVTALFDSKRT